MTVPSGWCAIRIATSPMPAIGPSRNSCTRHAGCSHRSGTQSSVKARGTAQPGSRRPLRGQLRIAFNSGVSKDEIVDLFIHLEAYAGAARAFEMYQIAIEAFTETDARE